MPSQQMYCGGTLDLTQVYLEQKLVIRFYSNKRVMDAAEDN